MIRPSLTFSRRGALSLLGAGAAAAGMAAPTLGFAQSTAGPILATPEQVAAERQLIALLGDPELKALQAKIRAELAASPRGQIPNAAARVDEAVAQWTNSLIFKEIAAVRAPAILWGTDDTPRTWLGHTLGGVGTSGDNPDNIYRSAFLDGGGAYEITGRVDPARKPAQFSLEVVRGDGGQPAKLLNQGKGHADMGNQIAILTDKELVVGPDGGFRITLGGAAEGPNHIALEPGQVTIGFRDTLSDWAQRPNRLAIRRLDGAAAGPFDAAELRRRVLAKLPGYIQFWSAFPDVWFGGLAPNAFAGPIPRDGGWGFLAGLRYRLADGEAIVVTTGSGQARYTGFQVVDPWMIAPNGKDHQASLNLTQAQAGPDGSFTYVIAKTDPGVANWLDTGGLSEGYGILRWQGLPTGATKDGLWRDFKVVRIADLAAAPGLTRVTPAERRAQLAARAQAYASRTL